MLVPKCPYQNCSQTLSTGSQTFCKLSKQLRQKYEKLLSSLENIKKNKRFCPECNSQLYIRNQGFNLECKKCHRQLCKECLSKAHQFRGRCQINFKQCSNCRFVVQKNQGCDHMTCICGYQFCYKCGKPRNSYSNHQCGGKGRKYSY